MAQPAATPTDLAHDVYRSERPALDAIFKPRAVAVIGATETAGSVGRTLVENLQAASFGGAVYPVNPKRDTVLGLPAYPAVGAVPGPVDLAVVVTPAPTVPGIIRECVEAGVKGAIVISAGFKERGAAGSSWSGGCWRRRGAGGCGSSAPTASA